ncbi:unnamed protein product [Angiostrongylus costaricensis]|uniref:Alpha-1,3-mannosyl-glycoprotein 2-beta-N-acetylglucosaminyltransferase n=1 Tax=Angiostrongylus costaricensis TaxID=334426 RepID=A0A0R3PNG5_ANGCS|nr:unnamed protein product [Angiostrongylus costaricensis]
MSAKRDKALRNHLEQLVRYVYLDRQVECFQHKGDDEPRPRSKNYAYIAQHYHWALNKLFNETTYGFVIITEDDLDIANDFFSYFEWGKQVLAADPTVWCVSAWNDNGLPSLVNRDSTAKIWRTDFFPGLGWMLTRELWMELSPKFPSIYWDDWMRTKEVRANRSCLRPEISRTAHNMKLAGKGSSGGLYKAFLSNIAVSSTPVDFSLLPYENMLKKNYDRELQETLRNSQLVEFAAVNSTVMFSSTKEWFILGQQFGIMVDIRGGMQRTAYYGIVSLMFKNCRIFLVPRDLNVTNFESYQYDPIRDFQLRYLEFAKVFCNSKMYTGICDPNSPEMIAWFVKKKWVKRLESYGKMIVN